MLEHRTLIVQPRWDILVWLVDVVVRPGAAISLAAAAHPRYSAAILRELEIVRKFDGQVVYASSTPITIPIIDDEAIIANKYRYSITLDIGECEAGVYELRALAELRTLSGDLQEQTATALFLMRAKHADVETVLLYPSFTAQAYNYFGGYSFYRPVPKLLPGRRRISVKRPQLPVQISRQPYHSPKVICSFENLLREQGISFDIIDSEYLHNNRENALRACRHLVIVGHDEYVTPEQRTALKNFLHNGGRISLFGGNFCWWKIAYDEQRCISVHKVTRDPALDDEKRLGAWCRVHPAGTPAIDFGLTFEEGGYALREKCDLEKALSLGLNAEQYERSSGMQVIRPDHAIFRGTGLSGGDCFGHRHDLNAVEIDGMRLDDTGAADLSNVSGIAPNTHFLAKSWLLKSSGVPANVATMAEVPYPRGGRFLHLGSIGWYYAIQHDPVCRLIAKNVLRYQTEKGMGRTAPAAAAIDHSSRPADFLLLSGHSRSGTTLSCAVLDAHPQIAMSFEVVPEPLSEPIDAYRRIIDSCLGQFPREHWDLQSERYGPVLKYLLGHSSKEFSAWVSRCRRSALDLRDVQTILDNYAQRFSTCSDEHERIELAFHACAAKRLKLGGDVAGFKASGWVASRLSGGNTKILYIIRQPLDVYASMRSLNWPNLTVEKFIRGWVGFYTRAKAVLDNGGGVIFRYEDLIDHDDRLIGVLTDYIGLNTPLEPEAYHERSAATHISSIATMKNDLWRSPLTRSQIGRWKDVLAREEIDAICLGCADIMSRHGYGPGPTVGPA